MVLYKNAFRFFVTISILAASSPSHAQMPGNASSELQSDVVSEQNAPTDQPMMAAIPVTEANIVSAMPAVNPQDAKAKKAMEDLENEINERLSFLTPSVDIANMRSLLFTTEEHDLLIGARKGLITNYGEVEEIKLEGKRDITLGGIIYKAPGNWTIWLNDTRVTPKALLNEIMNLKVYGDYIELEWFDAATNQIFPIRLRTHQRFNLDTRIFLPG